MLLEDPPNRQVLDLGHNRSEGGCGFCVGYGNVGALAAEKLGSPLPASEESESHNRNFAPAEAGERLGGWEEQILMFSLHDFSSDFSEVSSGVRISLRASAFSLRS